jgi:hypothetical protein
LQDIVVELVTVGQAVDGLSFVVDNLDIDSSSLVVLLVRAPMQQESNDVGPSSRNGIKYGSFSVIVSSERDAVDIASSLQQQGDVVDVTHPTGHVEGVFSVRGGGTIQFGGGERVVACSGEEGGKDGGISRGGGVA